MKFLSIASVAAVAAAVFGSAVFAADAGNASSGAVVAPKPAASASAPAAIKGTTRQAYLDQAAKRFDSMDANHDGILTSEERKAHSGNSVKSQGASSTVAPAKPSTAKM
jgi:hypothetical protein